MRVIGTFFGTLIGVGVIIIAARILGLEDLVRRGIESGHLADWIMGILCTLWLLIVLKAPWDLYFEAHRVAFEQARSRERGIPVSDDRLRYVRTVRSRLLGLAIGAHLGSAVLIAAIAWTRNGSGPGYWFAIFFLVSTLFHPMLAGYAYLWHRLRTLGQEAQYPREDVVTMRARLDTAEANLKALRDENETREKALRETQAGNERELAELRQTQTSLGREFEATVSRLTDNQEIIQGIKSFVRLIASATASG